MERAWQKESENRIRENRNPKIESKNKK